MWTKSGNIFMEYILENNKWELLLCLSFDEELSKWFLIYESNIFILDIDILKIMWSSSIFSLMLRVDVLWGILSNNVEWYL